MTLALSGLMAEPPGSVREYTLDEVPVDAGDELRLAGPVSGHVRLSRTNRGLVLDGRFGTAIVGECARCLRPLATPVDLRLDEEVLPSIDIASGLPVSPEEGADPEAPRLTDHHELELRPLILEAISLAEPIAPLCEPDCPGLCPECGERRGPDHAPHEAPIDPRLEVLRAFRVDGDRDSG
jgi:uncharacterized protein